MNQMKLFSKIAAATVIGTALVTVSPVKAFWWGSNASYEKIEEGMTSGELDRVKKGAIKEEGWIYSWTNPSNRNRHYIKKFDCRGSKCMYFSTTNKDNFKLVSINQADCSARQTRSVGWGPAHSNPWFEWMPGIGWAAAGRLICN